MNDIFFAASIDHHIYKIDLHGIPNVSSALEFLDRELFACLNTGARYCEVITGIGTGALKSAVQEHLKSVPFVKGYESSEQGGSLYVAL